MSNGGTEKLNPERLCKMEREQQGNVPVKRLTRLSDLLAGNEGEVAYTLNFAFNTKRRPSVTGEVSGGVQLECQRCMETFMYPIEASVAVQFITEEDQGQEVADGYEPVLTTEDGVRLSDIIEEELILAIPLVAKCQEDEDSACGHIDAINAQHDQEFDAETDEQVVATPRKPSPFDIL